MRNLLFSCFVFFIACTQAPPKVYQWRGDHRSGIYSDEQLLEEWSEQGPDLLWIIDSIGNGYGSPVIVKDKIYLTGERDSVGILSSYNFKGELNWESSFGKEWVTNFPGSRSTPTVVGDFIYVGSGLGNLYCFNAKDGSLIWNKNLKNDFEGVLPRFGHSESVLCSNDKVFWTPGGEEHNVVALNRFNGELIWSNKGFGERSAYHSPQLIKTNTRSILVTFTAYHLLGFDTETGELMWSQEQDNTPIEKRKPGVGDTHSNTVLYDEGAIYYAEGDGLCGVKLSLLEEGDSIHQVWRNKGFDSYMGGIVKIGDFLYGCGTRKKDVRSINALSGELVDSLTIGCGAIIAADDRLYYYTWKGEMNLIQYQEGQMNLLSNFKIDQGTKEHFSHPVIDNGILYLRRGQSLLAYDISKKHD
jgi:outer membrane protein assembly factor BamB